MQPSCPSSFSLQLPSASVNSICISSSPSLSSLGQSPTDAKSSHDITASTSMRREICSHHTARVRVQIEGCPGRGAHGLLPQHRIKRIKRDIFNAILREFIVLRPPAAMPKSPMFKHPRFNSGPSTGQCKKGGKKPTRKSSPSRMSSHSFISS